MKTLTKADALALAASRFWEDMTWHQRAELQLFEPLLCMPFDVFHEAVEHALNRPVWTHEFADMERLQQELLGERTKPTMEQILNLIPADKRVLLVPTGPAPRPPRES